MFCPGKPWGMYFFQNLNSMLKIIPHKKLRRITICWIRFTACRSWLAFWWLQQTCPMIRNTCCGSSNLNCCRLNSEINILRSQLMRPQGASTFEILKLSVKFKVFLHSTEDGRFIIPVVLRSLTKWVLWWVWMDVHFCVTRVAWCHTKLWFIYILVCLFDLLEINDIRINPLPCLRFSIEVFPV